jgi:hypothetical protein
VCSGVAHGAEGNQVVLRVCALLRTVFLVVDLEVAARAAQLAGPPVTAQDFKSEL